MPSTFQLILILILGVKEETDNQIKKEQPWIPHEQPHELHELTSGFLPNDASQSVRGIRKVPFTPSPEAVNCFLDQQTSLSVFVCELEPSLPSVSSWTFSWIPSNIFFSQADWFKESNNQTTKSKSSDKDDEKGPIPGPHFDEPDFECNQKIEKKAKLETLKAEIAFQKERLAKALEDEAIRTAVDTPHSENKNNKADGAHPTHHEKTEICTSDTETCAQKQMLFEDDQQNQTTTNPTIQEAAGSFQVDSSFQEVSIPQSLDHQEPFFHDDFEVPLFELDLESPHVRVRQTRFCPDEGYKLQSREQQIKSRAARYKAREDAAKRVSCQVHQEVDNITPMVLEESSQAAENLLVDISTVESGDSRKRKSTLTQKNKKEVKKLKLDNDDKLRNEPPKTKVCLFCGGLVVATTIEIHNKLCQNGLIQPRCLARKYTPAQMVSHLSGW